MKKVCDEKCNSKYPYSTAKILKIAVPFLLAGTLLLFSYNIAIIRYGILVFICVSIIIFRRRIINMISDIFKLRKSV